MERKKVDTLQEGKNLETPLGNYYFGEWKAQGRSHEPALLCGSNIANTTKFGATITFINENSPLLQSIGIILKGVDIEAYQVYLKIYDSWLPIAALTSYQTCIRSCFMCIALLRSTRVGPHKNKGDFKGGWTTMGVFGRFDGGAL